MPVEVLRTLRRYEAAGLLAAAQAGVFATEVGEATVRYAAPDLRLFAAVWARRHNLMDELAGTVTYSYWSNRSIQQIVEDNGIELDRRLPWSTTAPSVGILPCTYSA